MDHPAEKGRQSRKHSTEYRLQKQKEKWGRRNYQPPPARPPTPSEENAEEEEFELSFETEKVRESQEEEKNDQFDTLFKEAQEAFAKDKNEIAKEYFGKSWDEVAGKSFESIQKDEDDSVSSKSGEHSKEDKRVRITKSCYEGMMREMKFLELLLQQAKILNRLMKIKKEQRERSEFCPGHEMNEENFVGSLKELEKMVTGIINKKLQNV